MDGVSGIDAATFRARLAHLMERDARDPLTIEVLLGLVEHLLEQADIPLSDDYTRRSNAALLESDEALKRFLDEREAFSERVSDEQDAVELELGWMT